MYRRSNTRTDLALVASGAWAKVGSKHYRHVTGIEVRYDHNAWGWRVSTDESAIWPTLELAAYEAERHAAS